MNSSIKVKFWGTRGGLAKPGPTTLRYGGNTPCVQVTSPGGSLVVIDCGTGLHALGQHLMADGKIPQKGSILISHTHWDHIQGFPFFAPLFVPGGQWDVYGPAVVGHSLQETLAGQMEHTYFPITLAEMGAQIRFHELVEGEFDLDDIHITARYLNHPALTLGYRLKMGNADLVYACDHEPHAHLSDSITPRHELDRRHGEFISGTDLLIHDAQFTELEYVRHRGWGHSSMNYVVELAQEFGVKQVALTHHDPSRTDGELDLIVEALKAGLKSPSAKFQVFAAVEGQVVELNAGNAVPSTGFSVPPFTPDASRRAAPVLIGMTDPALSKALLDAAKAEGVRVRLVQDPAQSVELAESEMPGLIFLEDFIGSTDGLEICQLIRQTLEPRLQIVPIVMVAPKERGPEGRKVGVTQWLITPFSGQYARTQIQSWLLRSAYHWVRPGLPSDEAERLKVLRELAILDTSPEEKFDRITRIAAAISDVPIALVSLIDQDRQWFKSCFGLKVTETSREVSFCAHAITSRETLIVPDTLLDDRFADNPLVTGGPLIRFYAGFPIFHMDGACLGTLCLIDTLPRHLTATIIARLEDLAILVQREINGLNRHPENSLIQSR